MSDLVPMTKTGLAMLEEELHRLKTVDRRQNIKDIKEAREHGDLSENAEYHAAKNHQSFLEGRILDLESKIASANVIDVSQVSNPDRVAFGAFVKLYNVDTEEESEYQIVGEDEADVNNGKISYKSPIAHALIGKEEADEVRVRVPGGIKMLEILEIRY